MSAPTPIDPNAYEPTDDLVLEEEYDPLAAQDPAYDAAAAQAGETQEEAERRAAIEAEEEFLPYMGDPDEDHAPEVVVDERPAIVRTEELFSRMKPRRRILLAILRACAEPQDPAVLTALADDLQRRDSSVYDAPALCSLLERSGALERHQGEASEPQTVVGEDGVEYLQPAEPPVVRWVRTEAGTAMVEADQPLERLRTKFDTEASYKPIYLRVLRACAEGDGKTAKELGELVDRDPLVQKPRMFAAHFFNVLGECDALSWDGTWRTTEFGLSVMEELELSGVEDQAQAN